MNNPVGVFDSGVGGLTVLRELVSALPSERFVYLGDTARVPYGGKSADTVTRYAIEIANHLIRVRDIKLLVVACNTASSLALPVLRKIYKIPVVGMVDPCVRRAASLPGKRTIGVIGTLGTVRSGAYEEALRVVAPDMTMHGRGHGGLHEGKFDLVGAGKILVLGEVEARVQVFADLPGNEGVKALFRDVGVNLHALTLVNDVSIGIPLWPVDFIAGADHADIAPRTAKVEWQPDSDTNFYASYSKGYRSGGFNIGISAKAANKDLAWEFVKYITKQEVDQKATMLTPTNQRPSRLPSII